MAIVIKKLQELKIETVTPQELLPNSPNVSIVRCSIMSNNLSTMSVDFLSQMPWNIHKICLL